jgi:phage tail tube protein FII
MKNNKKQEIEKAYSWFTTTEFHEKETKYGTWKDFEKATGMTKDQYFAKKEKVNNELAELEVESSIFRL